MTAANKPKQIPPSPSPTSDEEDGVKAPSVEDYVSDPSQGGGGPLIPIITPPDSPVGGYPKPGER